MRNSKLKNIVTKIIDIQVKWSQGVENPHAFKHEMNRTPWKSTEMFQETSCRSSKQEPHNLQQAGIFYTNPKPQQTLRALALSSLLSRLDFFSSSPSGRFVTTII